jgi:hypothetical protein
MTLSAFAAVEPAKRNPKAIAAVTKETSEWRMTSPTNPKPGMGLSIKLARSGPRR